MIWLTDRARTAAIGRELSVDTAGQKIVLVVAHFDERIEALSDTFRELGYDPCRIDFPLAPSHVVRLPSGIHLVHSRWLEKPDDVSVQYASVPLHLIAVEPHFMSDPDHAIYRYVGGFTGEVGYSHHASLDDPLMRAFASDRTRQLLVKMGMTEDDPLEHDMVSGAMLRAQTKLARQFRSLGGVEAPTSIEGWTRLLFPGRSDAGK